MTVFSWDKLLSQKRVRDLYEGPPSIRAKGDQRTAFDQDYGRAVFSTPVRRLQDKAQVFPLEAHDSVRTRLTHSIEVSSVARGLGTRAENFVRQVGSKKVETGTLSTIAATCGLIHDIGNPPFGHAGEKAIATWFERRAKLFKNFPGKTSEEKLRSQCAQDFLSFDGNAQTQRLLSSLQILADRFGLNMTCATLSASLKYTVRSHERDKKRAESKKHGFFASENDLIQKVKEEVGIGDARHPIAFLVEAADDITYATVDLEDGVKKGCLDWATLTSKLRSRAGGKMLEGILRATREKIEPAKLKGRARDESMAISFRTNAVIAMVTAAGKAFEKNYKAIMRGEFHKSLLAASSARDLAEACKSIGFEYVYSAPQTLKLELMGRKVIWDLLSLYWEAARHIGTDAEMPEFARRSYDLISANYRKVCAESIRRSGKSGLPPDYHRMQLITDQVCGMTDTFAVTLHKELMNG